MKIGVISDTHIPDRAECIPPQILEVFKGVDMIVHVGDLLELEVLDTLRAVCKNVKAVYGNMDSYEIRKILPEKEIIKVGKYRMGIMHGYGPPNDLVDLMTKEFKDEGVNLIIFGHSHAPFNEKKGDILYFNPGSATDKIFAPYNSYGIIEVNDKIEAKIIRI
ncbi:MAG: metallophosphoesterase [Candidatus Omnitrophica bacterium]|nr:metallophosphoesterase [Candidatus Omnitrophota bacterium]MBU4345799.1 metallophosphoesterase [Candidatus Omnitrophota bacterium]MBU4473442.1 metallophosphoesterase [Candidatus Omnitrophota bacterium]MCG2706223.1 metallophosphoesterase [Candidatus Omnitrophota bacterium]